MGDHHNSEPSIYQNDALNSSFDLSQSLPSELDQTMESSNSIGKGGELRPIAPNAIVESSQAAEERQDAMQRNNKKRSVSAVPDDSANKKQRVGYADDSEIEVLQTPTKTITVVEISSEDEDDLDAPEPASPTQTVVATPKHAKAVKKEPITPASMPRGRTKKKQMVETEEESESEAEQNDDSEEYEDDSTDVEVRKPVRGTSKSGRKVPALTERQKFDNKIRELKEQHKQRVAGIRKAKDKKLAEATKEYKKKLLNKHTQFQVRLDEHKTANAEQKEAHAKKEMKMKEAHEKKEKEMKTKHEKAEKETKDNLVKKTEDNLNEKLAAFDKRVQELKDKKEAAECELREAKADFREKLKEAKGDKDTSVKELQPEHSRTLREKEAIIADLKQRIVHLTTAREAQQATIVHEQMRVTQLKTVIDEKHAEFINLQGRQIFDREAHERTVVALQNQYRIADQAVGLETRLKHEADVELVQARRQSTAMNRAVEKMKAEMEGLKEQLRDARVIIATMENKSTGRDAVTPSSASEQTVEYSRAWEMYERIRGEAKVLQMELEKSKSDNLGYQTLIGSLEGEVQTLYQRLEKHGVVVE